MPPLKLQQRGWCRCGQYGCGHQFGEKGRTLLDTAYTLEAMRPDFIVVRHGQAGAPLLLAQSHLLYLKRW